jgi:tetratricopeptide (TPR) repeat protein
VRARLFLAELAPAARWTILGLLGVVIVLAVFGAVWTFLQQREASARRASAAAVATYRTAIAPGADAKQLEEAARSLKQLVTDYPRASGAASAWYYLGNIEYQRGNHDVAVSAFEEAARRDHASIGVLSRLGAGYAWEAKQDPSRALSAYQEGLKGRTPKDFQSVELLLGIARAQEQLKQPAAAVETYRRILKEAPEAPRAEEARARLALLGATAS